MYMAGKLQSPNCHDLWLQGYAFSGLYSIYVPNYVESHVVRVCYPERTDIRVYCDMTDEYGCPGWIVFQRRQDESVNFT